MFQKKGIRSAKAVTLGMQLTCLINHTKMTAVGEISHRKHLDSYVEGDGSH